MTHASTLDRRSIDAARWAISTVFLLNGAGIGLWAAHVPTVQARMGIDTGMLSMVLLTVAGGALLAMPLMGGLTGRWGTRRMVLLSGFAFAAMTPLIMGAPSLPLLFIAAFLFGVSNGALDVAMNANASEVETARGLPTMSSFHGFFSLGGLFGAGLGGLLVGQGLGLGHGALMVGVVTAVVLALSAPRVMGFAATHGAGSHFSLPRGAALGLGLLALLCFAVEGALVDWSALLMQERTGGAWLLGVFDCDGGVPLRRRPADRALRRAAHHGGWRPGDVCRAGAGSGQHALRAVGSRFCAGGSGRGERGAAAVRGRRAHPRHERRERRGSGGHARLRWVAAGAAGAGLGRHALEHHGGAGRTVVVGPRDRPERPYYQALERRVDQKQCSAAGKLPSFTAAT
jgi:hypothetical protein